MGGPEDPKVLDDFWRTLTSRKDPRLIKHPMVAKEGWSKLACPLMLHGDAVACISVGKAGSKSYDVCSLQGLLAKGSTKAIKLLICGIFE
eukprot:10954653-Alexandrium_andersonii.AAC.1